MRLHREWLVILAVLALTGCGEDLALMNPPHDALLPAVAITQPSNGAAFEVGNMQLQAVAADNAGVARVEFYDGVNLVGVDSSATGTEYSVSWSAVDGRHGIKARAVDLNGNVATDSVTVSCGVYSILTEHSGHIGASETWTTFGNPHVIIGDIEISSPADTSPILTILPGCVVQFDGNFQISCGDGGAIVANGTADSTITFRATGARIWKSISIRANAGPETKFTHCVFQRGGGGGSAAVLDVQGAARIENCVVTGSASAGIHFGPGAHAPGFAGNIVTSSATRPIEADDPAVVGDLGVGNTLTGNAQDVIAVAAGTVGTSATWRNQGVPYVFGGAINVESTSAVPTLTIAPGARLEFPPGSELGCGQAGSGAIVAHGTADLGIVFTTALESPQSDVWRGVRVYSQATSAVSFRHCTVEYAGESGTAGIYLAAPASVADCTVRECSNDGVQFDVAATPILFSGNSVLNCRGHAVEIAQPDVVRGLGGGNSYTGNISNDIFIEGGEAGVVSSSGTWLNQGIPYVISGDLGVEGASNPVLTIAPGTTLELDGEFYVGRGFPGGLIADGTAGTITLRGSRASPARGDWIGVSFYQLAIGASCRLSHCTIEYGGRRSTGRGDVFIRNALPEVSACAIGHSAGYGIFLDGATHPDPSDLAANNTFYDNRLGNIFVPPR